jgi:hypothetical protein
MFRPDRSNRCGANRPTLAVRTALTLMETLVAIFIMAIGMLALLTLFPLGALRMEQALKDERCAQAGVAATEFAKILDLANDPQVRLAMTDPNAPNSPVPGASVIGGFSPGSGAISGPSMAVLVDPAGSIDQNNPKAVDPAGNLVRVASSYWNNTVTLNGAPPYNGYYEFFTLTDDIVFQLGTGIPRQFGTSGNAIGRETKFSWSYLLQQPQVQNPGITNYTACIYHRRPLAGSLDWVLPKAQLNINAASITFDSSDPTQIRPIQPGQWVLDVTLAKGTGPTATGGPNGAALVPMANFYRILSVRSSAIGSTATTILDLQGPIRGYSALPGSPAFYPSAFGGTNPSPAVFIIQESLVEVIDIGPLR